MSVWLFTILNVAVAGLIGGVTNYLAIKMLFHPRRAWVVLGRRVPFTPGLIPKRKGEIAAALGDVVADYLVTPDAVRELFGKSEFRAALLGRLLDWLKREIGETDTLGDVLRRWAGQETAERWLAALPEETGRRAGQAFARLWDKGGWSQKRIRDLVPGWGPEEAARWAHLGAGWVLDAVKDRLVSAEGQVALRKLAADFLGRQEGFVGFLAGIFLDEDRLVARLMPVLTDLLENEEVRAQFGGWVERLLAALGDMTLEEALGKIAKSDEPPERQAKNWIENGLPWKEWAEKLGQWPAGRWLAEREDTWRGWVEAASGAALDALMRHAPAIMETLGLREMVRAQVERFPVEELERVMLRVSGREFRAITWLGVLLGGMIGLIQSIIIRLWPGG